MTSVRTSNNQATGPEDVEAEALSHQEATTNVYEHFKATSSCFSGNEADTAANSTVSDKLTRKRAEDPSPTQSVSLATYEHDRGTSSLHDPS